MSFIDERVSAGAAFLDQHDPLWWREDVPNAIDLDRLKLENPALCVLGQRCPLEVLFSYTLEVQQVCGYLADQYLAYAMALSKCRTEDEIQSWAVAHGFTLQYCSDQDEWAELNLAWWTLINDRRKRAADEGDVR